LVVDDRVTQKTRPVFRNASAKVICPHVNLHRPRIELISCCFSTPLEIFGRVEPHLPQNFVHPLVVAKQISSSPDALKALRPPPREASEFSYKDLRIKVSTNLIVTSRANDGSNNAPATRPADDIRKCTSFQQPKNMTEVIKACKKVGILRTTEESRGMI
jgi:hypothetical protein